jgi:subtilisin family serine protease
MSGHDAGSLGAGVGGRAARYSLVAVSVATSILGSSAAQFDYHGPLLHPMEQTTQVTPAGGQLLLREALEYVQVPDARAKFQVTGRDLTAAVLDTGLNVDHVDFRGAIKASVNFSSEDSGQAANVTDRHGHGTNVAGIIVANGPARADPKRSEAFNISVNPAGMHQGAATGASIAVLKVMPNATFGPVEDALEWVVANFSAHGITAVNMSIYSSQNLQADNDPSYARMRKLISALVELRIPVVISSGNSFAAAMSVPGMSYPGIIREGISVAAVYDADLAKNELPKRYPDYNGLQAIAFAVKRGQMTPFSQRLPETAGELRTDLVAPGAVIVSSGIKGQFGESTQEGTSQAAPIVTGIILLMQEWYRNFQIAAAAKGDSAKEAALRAAAINDVNLRPPVAKLLEWLRTGERITDDHGQDDNVENTKGSFPRVDAMAAFAAMTKELQKP